MNYEKMFKKLAEQIRQEREWCEEAFKEDRNDPDKLTYDRGMRFAYNSIISLVKRLEKGEFDFES